MPALVVLVDFVPRSSYSSVSVGVVHRSQCIALVSVSTDFVPHSIRGLVSIKKDYLGSSTVQASVDVRSFGGRSIDRRHVYALLGR
jgi:hypothetical protein